MNRFLQELGASPAASGVLVLILASSLIALYRKPGWIERGVFRPYWFLRKREYPTLFSSAFLHADLAHLLFNAFTFFAFAFPLERAIGSPRWVALYLFGLLASTFGTWVQHRDKPEYRTLGASGAILAVLFASIVHFPEASIMIFPLPVPIPAPLFAVLYLAFSYWASKRGEGSVNHDAHISGALAGLAFVALTDLPRFASAVKGVLG